MKVEFEKNLTMMKILSLFIVTSSKIYLEHAHESGINLPAKIFIIYTIYPLILIFTYPLFIQINRYKRNNEKYFKFLNDIIHINFVLIGGFIALLITMEFWHKIGFLLHLINLLLGALLVNGFIMMMSLLISWKYLSKN